MPSIFVKKSLIRLSLCVTVLSTMSMWAYAGNAEKSKETDEDLLVQKIKDAVINELRNSNILSKEIDAGIARYVEKQKEAQRQAEQAEMRANEEKAKNVRPVSAARDHIFGNPDAEISLIEYSDYECPYCRRFHPVIKQTIEAYKGKVNWVYRHFPLDIHAGALKFSLASECAAEQGGETAFWQYTDKIYSTPTSSNLPPVEKLMRMAKDVGLNQEIFKNCLESSKFTNKVREDFENGVASGVTGTPGNLVRNNRTGTVKNKSGAVPFTALKAEIDSLLAE